ncbi:MAG: ribosome-associated translation inhibitor RaiA [Myxococcales bacterium]|nr:ribosome-associated translation inhibitor RaiA [Myxococcales bacterium]USN49864.1 MAG: ribosome-associated translation inhibitor RaiA [Myxococcales bacterium]
MQTSVTFRHMTASDALKDHGIDKISRLAKWLGDNADAHIVLSTERYLFKAEVNINAHGLIICSKEVSSDMYNSIDRAVEKIEKQVKRYRERLSKDRPKNGSKLKMQFKLLEASGELDQEAPSDIPPTIVETKEFQARPMMLDEAVMQMDLLHNDILVFLNAKTDHINVLYRKKGNKYGLIETSNNGD